MTTIQRPPGAPPATLRRDPRDQWPEHARKLYEHLVGLYGEEDPLPTLAAGWIAHQPSANTQRAYARGFRVFEEFAREHGEHPVRVTFMLADTFSKYLETAPTWVPVNGGRRGEMVRTGEPYSDASRANALSSASSFFAYLDKVSDKPLKNPFDAVRRPVIDPDYSPTPGYTETGRGFPSGWRRKWRRISPNCPVTRRCSAERFALATAGESPLAGGKADS